jgi:hypothetical protein
LNLRARGSARDPTTTLLCNDKEEEDVVVVAEENDDVVTAFICPLFAAFNAEEIGTYCSHVSIGPRFLVSCVCREIPSTGRGRRSISSDDETCDDDVVDDDDKEEEEEEEDAVDPDSRGKGNAEDKE